LDDDGRPAESHYVVKVTTAKDYPELLTSLAEGAKLFLSRKGHRGNTPYHCGDLGHMNGVGILSNNLPRDTFETNIGCEGSEFSLYLPLICRNVLNSSNQKFPGVAFLIDYLETTAGIQ
jgi:hypothetical protein